MWPEVLIQGELSMPGLVNDALSLEYKLLHGRATRYLDIADLMNDPSGQGIINIPGDGFEKEVVHFLFRDVRSVDDDRSDPLLVGLD